VIHAGDAPLVEAIALHAWYGSSHVLHGVDVTIGRGETLGLLGRNGMGKSTLIRTLLGHVTQREGRIVIRGHDMSRARPHEVARLGIAYVPEGRGVFPNLSTHENLVMAARAGVDGRRAWTLERVLKTFPRLAERLDNLGSQLSGGEQQMLSTARALMTNPALLLLDEPLEGLAPIIVEELTAAIGRMIADEGTEGLAPQVVDEIWRVIETIRGDGIATLIVDRHHRRVAAHAERLLVLQKGMVAMTGDAAQLRGDPALTALLGL
jgi:branched-chain amino acid transport system ATP-binding protein